MIAALSLFAIQGVLGAFDTLYYHEYRARLPSGGAQSRPELRLHALRDFIYAVIFGTLALVRWGGALAAVLLVLIGAEIVITLVDFAIEDEVRVPLGGVFKGERATHTLMAIVYGAALAHLVPAILADLGAATGFTSRVAPAPLPAILVVFAVGVFASGLRDLSAAWIGPAGGWPWPPWRPSSRGPSSPA
jgi:hypothetical protein